MDDKYQTLLEMLKHAQAQRDALFDLIEQSCPGLEEFARAIMDAPQEAPPQHPGLTAG